MTLEPLPRTVKGRQREESYMTVTRKFSEEICQSLLVAGACGVELKGIFPNLLPPRLWVCFVCSKSGTVRKEGVRVRGAESALFSLVSDKIDSEYGLYSCSSLSVSH